MSTQTDFISRIKAGAQSGQQKYGVLASMTMAQAIVESGWGKYAPGNNLFGIKANGTTGATVTIHTKEFVNGEYTTITALFRAYSNFSESVTDHGKFLASNARYKNLLGCKDYVKSCQLIQQDGYATEPDYADQLISIIKEYALNQYDGAAAVVAAKHIETVKGGTFYIHAKASTVSASVGITKVGQAFVTTVLANGWRQITYNGKTAYIGGAAFK
jgi:lysozyme